MNLDGQRLPCAVVDLDALERNVDRIRERLEGKRCRVASKSVRHVGLLRRILRRGGASFQGLMCFTAEEAVFLHAQGFRDLLVAYPTLQPAPLGALAGKGSTMVDCSQHVQAAARAGRSAGTPLEVLIELDVSYRRGPVHLGARRSPIRSPEQALRLAEEIRATEGVRLIGLMAYEAHVAGVPDASPFSPAMNPLKRAMKRLAQPEVRRLREATVAALIAAGHSLRVVNGGGTGSVHLTAQEDCVTEVTAGSGFVCSHLFSGFQNLDLEPAAFFACEAVRRSDPDMVTVLGGGYVASGEPGWDKVPVPVGDLKLTPLEAAGEVQTPLTGAGTVALGAPVLFRHAKAGELAERFNTYLLVRGGEVVGEEPTYRGEGQAFL